MNCIGDVAIDCPRKSARLSPSSPDKQTGRVEMTLELTKPQRQAVQEQAGEPVEVIDPDTQRAYVLLAREQDERMRSLVESERETTHRVAEVVPGIPPDILRSQQAFWRDLPELLSQSTLRGRWVCYQEGERIGIGTYDELIRECGRCGIPDDGFYLGRIRPRELPPWEPEDVEPLGPHHRESAAANPSACRLGLAAQESARGTGLERPGAPPAEAGRGHCHLPG
jgi:hypothetical protein